MFHQVRLSIHKLLINSSKRCSPEETLYTVIQEMCGVVSSRGGPLNPEQVLFTNLEAHIKLFSAILWTSRSKFEAPTIITFSFM